MVRRMVNKTTKSGLIIVSAGVVLYSVLWSFISIHKYYALNASVYDLGFSMQSLWFVTHEVKTPYGFYTLFVSKGLLYILAPLYYVMSAPLLLIIQSVALGMGSLALYGIALTKLKVNKIAITISIFYLIYFPMAGINWFDFHYQMFFIVLFLFGYYSYIKEKYVYSLIFFGLSGLVRYPYYIFPLLFSFFILLEDAINKIRYHSFVIEKKFLYMSVLLLFDSFLLISQLVILKGISGLSSDVASNGAVLNGNSIWNGFIIFFYLLFPLLFLPLLSKKWIVFMLPFAALVFTSNSFGYSFPHIFQDQYTAGIIPFIWLAFIDALDEIGRFKLKKVKIRSLVERLKIFNGGKGVTNVLVISVSFLIILSAIAFEPYGPLNKYTNDNFNISGELNINESQSMALRHIVSLIPNGNPYVYIQNNLPQAMYGHFSKYILSLYVPQISSQNIVNNDFPYHYGGDTPIDYLIGDVNNYNFYTGNPSMLQFTKELFDSGYYYIAGESYGIFLLERVPMHTQMYLPDYNVTIEPPSKIGWRIANSTNDIIFNENHFNLFSEFSDYILPGKYSVTVDLFSPNKISLNELTLQIETSSGDSIAQFSMVNLSFENEYYIRFNVSINSFYSDLYINSLIQNFTGSLYINSIVFNQISPITVFSPFPGLQNFYSSHRNQTMMAFSSNLIYSHYPDNKPNLPFWIETNMDFEQFYPQFLIISNFPVYNSGIENYIVNLTLSHKYAVILQNAIYEILELNEKYTKFQMQFIYPLPINIFYRYNYVGVNNNYLILDNLTSNQVGWFGPNLLLFPGNYSVTFFIEFASGVKNDSVNLDVYYPNLYGEDHNIIINSTYLSFDREDIERIMPVTINFAIHETTAGVQFRAMDLKWKGELYFSGAILKYEK